MDAYTHTILAVIVTAVAYYVGRYMMLRSITLTDDDRLQARRLITVLQAINHMGINPEPKEQDAEPEPTQLDLFLTEGSTGGTD
tara:strand:- start:925 stop:1176 length:252 start_codon:yes stop_codon:yes gene_type:complete